MHGADRCFDDRTRGVTKTLAWFQYRLFTDDTLSFDLFGTVFGVSDVPVS